MSERVAFARGLRKSPTDAEDTLWQTLRGEFREAKFRRQVPIGPFVADFLSYAARLVVEADGAGHDATKDALRDAWFAADGWQVVRFSNAVILTDLLHVKRTIRVAIDGERLRSEP